MRTVRLTSLPWAGGEEGGTVPALFCSDIIAEAQFAVKINFYSRLLVLFIPAYWYFISAGWYMMKYAEKYGVSHASRKYNKSRPYVYFRKVR